MCHAHGTHLVLHPTFAYTWARKSLQNKHDKGKHPGGRSDSVTFAQSFHPRSVRKTELKVTLMLTPRHSSVFFFFFY